MKPASRRLTIGMFTDSYRPEINGVVTSIVGSVETLRRRGHRVIVIAPAHDSVVDRDPDVFRFRSVPFPFYQQIRMAFPLPAKLLMSLPQMPFDIVHTHSLFFVGCLGAFLAQRRGVPLVFTYHTRWTEYAHYLPLSTQLTQAQAVWISREFCNRCTDVVTPTRGIGDVLREFGVTRPISVIPTGVDLDAFRGGSPDPQSIRADADGPIVLYAGRLGKEKNLDLLLSAFAIVAQRVPRARLVVVGCGPDERRLRSRAAAMPCVDRIRFLGALDKPDLGSYYRAADVFAFASTTETQGLVLVEALAHGLPVAAVDCPVSREVVAEGAGVLTEQRPDALADGILSVLGDDEHARDRRRKAAHASAAPYSIDRLTDELEALYVRSLDPDRAAVDKRGA
jgi:1,2-diacylglycerol 3-alpha-glucosyltransferase